MAPLINPLKIIKQIFAPNSGKPSAADNTVKSPLLSFGQNGVNTTLGYENSGVSTPVPKDIPSKYSEVKPEFPIGDYAPLDLTGDEVAQNPTFKSDIEGLESMQEPPRDLELAEV